MPRIREYYHWARCVVLFVYARHLNLPAAWVEFTKSYMMLCSSLTCTKRLEIIRGLHSGSPSSQTPSPNKVLLRTLRGRVLGSATQLRSRAAKQSCLLQIPPTHVIENTKLHETAQTVATTSLCNVNVSPKWIQKHALLEEKC